MRVAVGIGSIWATALKRCIEDPINQWGQVSAQGLKPDGITYVLREAFARGGVEGEAYTGHSLRRGFATLASSENWSTKELMDYVGWKDVKSALRYVDTTAPFGDWMK